jgi:hypothetical protein
LKFISVQFKDKVETALISVKLYAAYDVNNNNTYMPIEKPSFTLVEERVLLAMTM